MFVHCLSLSLWSRLQQPHAEPVTMLYSAQVYINRVSNACGLSDAGSWGFSASATEIWILELAHGVLRVTASMIDRSRLLSVETDSAPPASNSRARLLAWGCKSLSLLANLGRAFASSSPKAQMEAGLRTRTWPRYWTSLNVRRQSYIRIQLHNRPAKVWIRACRLLSASPFNCQNLLWIYVIIPES